MALKGLGSPSMEGGDEAAADIMAEINITPLVDVFLVLLIIFMVTTSVMSQMGVNVNLPTASQQTSSSQPEGVIITLRPNGGVLLNGQAMPAGDMGALQSGLSQVFAKTPSRLVILEGDKQALLGSAIQVMDSAKKAGAEKFAIATGPESAQK